MELRSDIRLRSHAMPRLLAGLAAACAMLATAQAAGPHGQSHHTTVPADKVAWGPGPGSLPPGAQLAVLLGGPAKEGPFVIRLKFPDGFVVPPHRHSKDEFVTVISGRFGVGTGEKLDRQAVTPLPQASFVHLPAGMPHFAVADGETIVQINGTGPFDVVYLDPKDDPRKQ
jgi:quercetin dioxygenase-like cupin family protein